MEQDMSQWTCNQCGNAGMSDGGDGYYYCLTCYSQADDVMDTGVADEDLYDRGDQTGALYSTNHKRHRPITQVQPISQYNPQTHELWSQRADEHNEHDSFGPVNPTDFGSAESNKYSYEGYYKELRNRYVLGLQMMLQAQCEALVDKFKVNPLICGIVGPIWLRYVVSTGILGDDWADEAIKDSEIEKPDEAENLKRRVKHGAEPYNIHGQRALVIWFRYLRKKIPLSCSLAVSFLGCHVLREAILPTDIVKWSVEGKLTYFDAFVEIQRRIGQVLPSFPIKLDQMFRPSQAVSAQKLESLAAQIALAVGFHLPPVNFYAIASRYLSELSLPIEKIISTACRIYEWVMPPDLWLSANELKLPTRTCVMSILIVAIRILYNINGFGVWERSLRFPTGSDNAGKMEDLDTTKELLRNLEVRYNEIDDTYDYSRDLPSYLQFCKDVIFAGLEPPLEFFQEEKSLIKLFWEFYQKNEKDSEPCDDGKQDGKLRQDEGDDGRLSEENVASDEEYHLSSLSEDEGASTPQQTMDDDDDNSSSQKQHSQEAVAETRKEDVISRLKKNMEENRFCYIPPRVNVKRYDYLHYARKKKENAMTYVAQADYYILLRACAKVAQVDVRIMHWAVLSFERRLAWTEEKIGNSLNVRTKKMTCQFCVPNV